ncbi:MAG: SGNH/GDSL hydrolase family protein [Myxococcota bacterium]
MQLNAKTALFGVATVLVGLIGIELVVRVVFSVASGESKLLYGLDSSEPAQKPGMLFPKKSDSARWHTVLSADDREKTFLTHETGSYSKYQPHQYKRNRDEYGHLSDIYINNLGFRGPDVAVRKSPGSYRVIVLGASSTFGYRNRDAETYPYYLEQILNERLRKRHRSQPGSCAAVDSFEVLNLGIPHLNAANIHSLLVAEGLDLDPDLVTFYAGANETRLIEAGPMQRVLSALGDRLITARFVRSMLRSYLSSFDAEELEHHASGLSENFLNHLSAVADATESGGVQLLIASQQAKSFLIPKAEMGEFSYPDEVRLVRNKLGSEGRISLKEMIFLMHAGLMRDLREWTTAREAQHDSRVAFVDVASSFDSLRKRDQLLSWVHLSAEANRIVATEFATPILDRACAEDSQAS